jgi:dTDP-4-amino-4,6-dideoxygalactose transaminase
VQTQVHYPIPPHRQLAYAHLRYLRLPVTERIHEEVLSLPMAGNLRDDQIERVIDACMAFTGNP